eukprot:scaffold270_cov347-Pavlova_lutheri.AAC.41
MSTGFGRRTVRAPSHRRSCSNGQGRVHPSFNGSPVLGWFRFRPSDTATIGTSRTCPREVDRSNEETPKRRWTSSFEVLNPQCPPYDPKYRRASVSLTVH